MIMQWKLSSFRDEEQPEREPLIWLRMDVSVWNRVRVIEQYLVGFFTVADTKIFFFDTFDDLS